MHRQVNLRSFFMILLCLLAAASMATAQSVHHVSSIAALQSAINGAVPGDQIILANGTYSTTGPINIAVAGTASQPILIAAQTIGGATITGASGFHFNSPAAFVVVQGFNFTHASSQAVMGAGATHCRFTRNVFQTVGAGEFLTIAGNDNEVDHNTFQNKTNLGRFIAVRGVGSQIAQRLWIHHNYFFNATHQSGNGAEGLQFGLSGFSLSSSNSIVEFNLFQKVDGENEMVSNKASAVTYRFNTFRDNAFGQFTLRHGNNCKVYGNYYINSFGIRFFGDDHQIYSNFFVNNNPAIQIGNGDGEVPPAPLTSHDRPDRVQVVYNTLINNVSNIVMTPRTGGLGATSTVIANNIIQGGGVAATITGPFPNPTWEGNILWNVSGPGDMPASGFRTVNPLLAADGNGEFHIQSGSPAIDSGVGSFPFVTVDMDGQPRDSNPDVGADEASAAAVTARILTTADVGPNAGLAPDFTFSATPASQTVTAGGSTSYTVSVSPTNGFNSSVSLGVSGLPTNTTSSFTPASISGGSGSSTLSVATTTSTPPGNYTLTATGSGGGASHSATTLLTVNPVPTQDFSIAASPASRAVTAGGSTTYTVNVGAINGFSGSVALSITGLGAGASGSFSPASITGSGASTLTITTTAAAATGTFPLTITGMSGSLSHSATVSLQVSAPSVCVTATAGGSWVNTVFPTKTGSFTAQFDATPSISPYNSVVGLSNGAQTAYAGFAALARFNSSGDIDARNGGTYAAAATIPYSAGVSYHFRLAINVTAHTYSIFVTPAGGTEQTVGTSFAFRTEQSTVPQLNWWGVFVGSATGSTKVCNFTVQ
ncbi:MAG TPA: polysaccharide lyase 6 family protein [Terriglobales bacterium]|nr:polysaccharide lyase 6 family protein [Terriglobales bacterium]